MPPVLTGFWPRTRLCKRTGAPLATWRAMRQWPSCPRQERYAASRVRPCCAAPGGDQRSLVWRMKKHDAHGASEALAGPFNAHRKSPGMVEASGDPLTLGKEMDNLHGLICRTLGPGNTWIRGQSATFGARGESK